MELIEILTGLFFLIPQNSGPVISPQSKERIISIINKAEKEGGKVLLDGRQVEVEGYPHGNWVGPTIIQGSPGMTCYELAKSFWTSLHNYLNKKEPL
jgi:hypothetical protein